MNQKYRSLEEIRAEYPRIEAAYLQGKFPGDDRRPPARGPLQIRRYAADRALLQPVGRQFRVSFAGKYSSVFCANQGSAEENLEDLLNAIRRIYASLLNPDALLYRRKNNLAGL